MSLVHVQFYYINNASRIGAAMKARFNISCNYKPGNKVRYKWKNDEIRSGIITHIDCYVNNKDSEFYRSRSVTLADVIGYDT